MATMSGDELSGDEQPVDAEHMARMRQNYADAGLNEADVARDWLPQFQRWFDEAISAGIAEPNAMVLATASAAGRVAARTVLAKEVTAHGVTFYTNYTSAKSHDLLENPNAAVTFPWYDLHRQIHIRGRAEKVSRTVTEAYWATRPRGSQIGAWTSPQSTVIADRDALDALQAQVEARFGGLDGADPIPVPPHWGGWQLAPSTVEFWQGRTARLHDRLQYRYVGGRWVIERLAP